jgi:hypothetical protein
MWNPNCCALTALAVAACISTGCSHSQSAGTTEAPARQPAYYEPNPAQEGTITGKAVFPGKPEPPRRIDMDSDPQCVSAHKGKAVDESLVVGRDGALANVFVYVKSGLEGKQFRPPAETVTFDQKGCWFLPRVIGLQTGQTLKVTNSDPVTHNIHPRARQNREWNHSQSPSAPAFERRFTRPEVLIRVKCDIHGWMRAWIGVVDNPYFAITGHDGRFEIPKIPAGEYTLGAWHEVLGTQEQKVKVTASGSTPADWTFHGE